MYRADKSLFWHPPNDNFNYDVNSFYANISDLPDFMTDNTEIDRDAFMMVDTHICVTWQFHHTRYLWDNTYGAILVYEYTTLHPRFKGTTVGIIWK